MLSIPSICYVVYPLQCPALTMLSDSLPFPPFAMLSTPSHVTPLPCCLSPPMPSLCHVVYPLSWPTFAMLSISSHALPMPCCLSLPLPCCLSPFIPCPCHVVYPLPYPPFTTLSIPSEFSLLPPPLPSDPSVSFVVGRYKSKYCEDLRVAGGSRR